MCAHTDPGSGTSCSGWRLQTPQTPAKKIRRFGQKGSNKMRLFVFSGPTGCTDPLLSLSLEAFSLLSTSGDVFLLLSGSSLSPLNSSISGTSDAVATVTEQHQLLVLITASHHKPGVSRCDNPKRTSAPCPAVPYGGVDEHAAGAGAVAFGALLGEPRARQRAQTFRVRLRLLEDPAPALTQGFSLKRHTITELVSTRVSWRWSIC